MLCWFSSSFRPQRRWMSLERSANWDFLVSRWETSVVAVMRIHNDAIRLDQLRHGSTFPERERKWDREREKNFSPPLVLFSMILNSKQKGTLFFKCFREHELFLCLFHFFFFFFRCAQWGDGIQVQMTKNTQRTGVSAPNGIVFSSCINKPVWFPVPKWSCQPMCPVC